MRLEVRNLVKTYNIKNQEPVKALDDVSLLFPETGLVFILGKSGSGKSTLLNVMGGLDSLDSGEIIINDRSSKSFSGSEMDSYRNTYLGFIFQEYNILNDFNIHDNVALAIELQNRKADEATINAILEEVDLKGFAKRKPNEMSGGQKQRVAIARALVKDPKIIFADEPTGALDSNTGKAVFETLRKLSKTRLVVCVSHDRDFAEHFGDRVIEMKDGKVISDISKRDVVPESAANGISLIGDNVIRFAPGRELTAADLPILNAALKKSDGQAFLSADKHVNETICESARISADGSRQEFFDTKKDDVKAGSGKFKAIKSHFPMKDAFRMGSKSLGVKPVRLTFTILLSFTSFALFGLTATMARVNATDVEANTLIDAGTKVLDVRRSGSGYGGGFNDHAVESVAEEFGTTVHPYIDFTTNRTITFGKSGEYINNPYYLNYFNKAVVIDDDFSAKLGFELIGKMPKEANEIAVTDWYSLAFKDFGWNDVNGKYHEGSTFQIENLIGTSLGNYRISGVFLTGIEDKLADYSSLKGKYNFDDWNIYQQVQSITSGAKAGFAYMSKDSFAAYLSKNARDNYYYSPYYSNVAGAVGNVGFGDAAEIGQAFYFDETKTSLEEDEVLISGSKIHDFIMANNLPSIGSSLLALEDVPHIDGEGNVVTTAFSSNKSYDETLVEVIERRIAGDKYTSFPNDYPSYFIEESRQDGFDLSYNDELGKLCTYNNETNAYDIEFKPFEVMTHGQIFGYLLHALNQVGYNNYDFVSGEAYPGTPQSVIDGLPYYNEYETYRENAKSYLDEAYKTQGFGCSIYYSAYSNAGDEARREYITSELSRQWWNATSKLEGSFAASWLIKRMLDNPDFNESAMADYDYMDAFSEFIYACREDYNPFTYESGYTPLNAELPYYEGYVAIVNTKLNNAAQFLRGSEPISLEMYKHNDDYGDEDTATLKIVGIVQDAGLKNRNSGVLYASMATIKKYVPEQQLNRGSYSGLLVETPNEAIIRKVVEKCNKGLKAYIENDYTGYYWNIEEPNYAMISSIMNTLEIMMKVFFYIGLFFLAFSMLLFYNFISASINNKRREIGILRAVGARGSDVFKIFYSESFVIALINFVLAGTATIIISMVLNNFFSSELGFLIVLLKPGFIELGLVLAAALLASFISALLPVLRIAHQKPVDAIRGK
ncbi:MAG: ABC transporter ATP-binding protein/permease [Bacilli bacterium]|nr:ABC transporter ATP-binding protein/permease [Bacilli bacterium]